MANPNPVPPSDLIRIDDDTPLDTGAGASSPDAMLNAAQVFQSQLDQMTAWKEQLAGQMEVMHRDGMKLLERQKNLAFEKQKAAEERTALAAERDRLQKQQDELANGRQSAETARKELERRHAELAAREQSLAGQEAHCLAQDVRLKENFEQLEGQRQALVEAQRNLVKEKESLAGEQKNVEARKGDLARREEQLHHRAEELQARELSLHQAQDQLDQQRQELRRQQDELDRARQALVEKERQIEAELQPKLVEAQQLRDQAAQEKQAVQNQRQEWQKKLEALEQEQAEQHETFAKQAKRQAERRAELEVAEQDINKALAERIAAGTGALEKQLADARGVYESRLEELQRKIEQLNGKLAQSENDAQAATVREAALAQEIADSQRTLAALRTELEAAAASLEQVKQENLTLARDLASQVEQNKSDETQWKQRLESAQSAAATGGDKAGELQRALDAIVKLRGKYDTLKEQLAAVKKRNEDLEFKLELQAEDAAKRLEESRAQLAAKIESRDKQIAELKAAVETAKAAMPQANSAPDSALQKQLATLEAQRDDLAQQLLTIQDAQARQQNDALLTKNSLEGKLLAAEDRVSQLEAEKSAWSPSPHPQTQAPATSGEDPAAPPSPASPRTARQRERLLQQARALRNFRRESHTYIDTIEKHRRDLAQQREQLRARKENLEQVKRLLEKQEMVMARKLADHNAIKTVAAVGIFVIMILGSTFFGVYHFVHPMYRSEAVVQLAPIGANKAPLPGAELKPWTDRQVDYIRNPDITSAAWKILRSADENYAMQDVRDEWLESLPTHLTVMGDAAAKTLTVRYTGPDAHGVAQVCNALAMAYTTPGMRDPADRPAGAPTAPGAPAAQPVGLGAQLLAKATPPLYPAEDNRISICMTVVAIALFVSLLVAMLFRHFVARQLREIDQMADAKDLEDMHDEISAHPADPDHPETQPA